MTESSSSSDRRKQFITAEQLFAVPHVELAALGLELGVYPHPSANAMRAAIAAKAIDVGRASAELEWYGRSPQFIDVMSAAVSRETLEAALSPRGAIVAELRRYAALMTASGRKAVAAAATTAAAAIVEYPGSWDADAFAADEPPTSDLKAAFVARVVNDVCRTGRCSLVDAAEKTVADPVAVAAALAGETGIPAARATAIVAASRIQTVANVDAYLATAASHTVVSESERGAIAYRQSLAREIHPDEIETWTAYIQANVFSAPPELPNGMPQTGGIRWSAVIDPDTQRMVRVVFFAADNSAIRTSEIAAKAAKPLCFLMRTTPFRDGGTGDACIAAIRLCVGSPVRRVAFIRAAVEKEFPFRVMTAAETQARLRELAAAARSRGMALRAYGLFIGDVSITAPGGNAATIPALIGEGGGGDASRSSSSSDTTTAAAAAAAAAAANGGTTAVVIPIAEMEASVTQQDDRDGGDDEAAAAVSETDAASGGAFAASAAAAVYHRRSAIEYEVRLNYQTRRMFMAVVSALRGSSTRVAETHTDVWIYRRNFRRIANVETKEVTVMRKLRIWSSENEDLGIRASVSREIRLRKIPTDVGTPTMRRNRRRTTVIRGPVRFDATHTRVFFINNEGGGGERHVFDAFEIEAEVESADDLAALNGAALWLLHVSTGSLVLYTIPERSAVFRRLNARLLAIEPDESEINKVFYASRATPPRLLAIVAPGILERPRDLKRHDITATGLGGGYTVAAKADGETRILFIDAATGLWLIAPPATAERVVENLDGSLTPLDGTVLAGEVIPHANRTDFLTSSVVFSPFDALALPRETPERRVGLMPDYFVRHGGMVAIINELRVLIPANVMVFATKAILAVGDTRDSLAAAVGEVLRQPLPFKTDGLIFTPAFTPQLITRTGRPFEAIGKRVLTPDTPDVCKWKPFKDLTVDLEIRVSPDDGAIAAMVASGRALVPFAPFGRPVNIDVSDAMLRGIPSGSIVEFAPHHIADSDDIVLRPTRVRVDKSMSNPIFIATDVYGSMTDPIPAATLLGEDFGILRSRSGDAKRRVIRAMVARRLANERVLVVDLGSGQGGDIAKIAPIAAATVWSDPDAKNVARFRERAPPGIPDIVHAPAQDTAAIVGAARAAIAASSSGGGIDRIVVSMMRSLSFFFGPSGEDLAALGATLRGLAELIPKPTLFVFETIEATRTNRLLDAHGGSVALGPATLRRTPDGSVATHIESTIVDSYVETPADLTLLSTLVAIEAVETVRDALEPAGVGVGAGIPPGSTDLYLTVNEKTFLDLFVVGYGTVIPTPDAPVGLAAAPPTKLPSIRPCDDFPYRRWFLPEAADMFDALVEDLRDFPSHIDARTTPEGTTVIVRDFQVDAMRADFISDLFSEPVRIRCGTAGPGSVTPTAAWERLRSAAMARIPTPGGPRVANIAEQRENVYKNSRECTTFNPTLVAFAAHTAHRLSPVNGGVAVLDPSAGWGDRLIGAIAANMAGISIREYRGFDPNAALTPAYAAIISTAASTLSSSRGGVAPPALSVTSKPFETAVADGDVPDNYFDLVVTSPPFYSLEIYDAADKTQSFFNGGGVDTSSSSSSSSSTTPESYGAWVRRFYVPYLHSAIRATRSGGLIAMYVSDFRLNGERIPLAEDTASILTGALGGAARVVRNGYMTVDSSSSSSAAAKWIRPFLFVQKPGIGGPTAAVPSTTSSASSELAAVATKQTPPRPSATTWFPYTSFPIPTAPMTNASSRTIAVRRPAVAAPVFADIADALAAAKRRLDPIPNASDAIRRLIPHTATARAAATRFGAQITTNAWLKMYEIANHIFSLGTIIGGGGGGEPGVVRMFANAELPGAFVSAVNHLVCTRYGPGHFEWVASSLFPNDATSATGVTTALGDTYGLYAANPSRWIMNADFRGDLSDSDALLPMAARAIAALGGVKPNLYTSDVGIPLEDETVQEMATAHLHLGQTIVGLAALAPGGAFVVKTFTFFHRFSIDLIAVLTTLFTSVAIVKPETSRATNSETYIVGTGYSGASDELVAALISRHRAFDFNRGLLPPQRGGSGTVSAALRAAAEELFATRQLSLLNGVVDGTIKAPRPAVAQTARDEWFDYYGVRPLDEGCKLHLAATVAKPKRVL